jgi:hypothetical protein
MRKEHTAMTTATTTGQPWHAPFDLHPALGVPVPNVPGVHVCITGPLCEGWEEYRFIDERTPDAYDGRGVQVCPYGPDCDHDSCWRIANEPCVTDYDEMNAALDEIDTAHEKERHQ